MNDVISVALSKLICWYDAPRIQTWPAMMASTEIENRYASVTDFGRRCGSDRMADSEHLADHDYVRNLPGLEIRSSRPVLRGVGLLEKVDGGYQLSEEGRRLGRNYREHPRGKAWGRCLARILLTREPRTRVLVRALSPPGSELVFTRPGWFAGSLQEAVITIDGQPRAQPFVAKRQTLPNLADLLAENPTWALGEWARHPLLLHARALSLTGYKGPSVSLHRIGQALKAPFEVLFHLGIVTHVDGRCRLDTQAAVRELGSRLAHDYGWPDKAEIDISLPLPGLLARIVSDIATDSGYVVASQLRQRLKQAGIDNPDREIARLEDAGQVVIEAASYGQGRHGKGLYGLDANQLVKLRITEGT